MIKALLKKQLSAMGAIFVLGKNGKRRNIWAIIGFAALMIYAVAAFALMFWWLCDTLCAPLVAQGLAWVYFAMMCIVATGICCICSVFAAKAQLYEAKDNDLLLSMPIPPWKILFVRMLSLYVMTFFFSAMVLIPAVIKYLLVEFLGIGQIFCLIILLFALPLLALAICCLLGWVIALLTAKMRSKNFASAFAFVAFFVGYYWGTTKLNEYLAYVIQHGQEVADSMNGALYFFKQFGLGATGNGLSVLIVTAICVAVFGIVYFIIDRTFLRIVTIKRGGVKTAYRRKERKSSPILLALIKREAKRIFNNPMVWLNCCLGSVFYIVLPVWLCFEKELLSLFTNTPYASRVALLLATVLCFTATTNIISGVLISLEGENLWIIRSMPVDTFTVLLSKLSLHTLVTGVPAAISAVAFSIITKLHIGWAIAVLVCVLAFVALCAVIGLAINLKLPNMQWMNEIAVVKQSFSTMVSLFIGWGMMATLVGGWFLLRNYLPDWAYMGLCMALIIGATAGLTLWIKERGVKVFEKL